MGQGSPWECAPCGSQVHNSFGKFGEFWDLVLPSFSGLALLSRIWSFLLGGWPFLLGFVWGPSFSKFGPSLSFVLTLEEVNCGITRGPLTPKVFSQITCFKLKINMLLLLTLVKVNSGIAEDAFTHKVALSPPPSLAFDVHNFKNHVGGSADGWLRLRFLLLGLRVQGLGLLLLLLLPSQSPLLSPLSPTSSSQDHQKTTHSKTTQKPKTKKPTQNTKTPRFFFFFFLLGVCELFVFFCGMCVCCCSSSYYLVWLVVVFVFLLWDVRVCCYY